MTNVSTKTGERGKNGKSIVRQPGKLERDPSRFLTRRRWIERGGAISLPVVLISLWQLAAVTGHIDQIFLPAPSRIAETAVDMITDGTLYDAVAYSLTNTLIGLVSGAVTGVITGLAIGLNRSVRVMVGPLVYALWTVPKLALLPLLLIVLGFGAAPQIWLIAISTFFLLLIPTIASVSSIPAAYREVASCLGARPLQMVRHVLLPAAMPGVFIALRLAAGAAVLVMVAAEFTQGDEGIGFLIWHSWSLLLTDRMYVGIVTVSVLGVALTQLVVALGRQFTPWSEEH